MAYYYLVASLIPPPSRKRLPPLFRRKSPTRKLGRSGSPRLSQRSTSWSTALRSSIARANSASSRRDEVAHLARVPCRAEGASKRSTKPSSQDIRALEAESAPSGPPLRQAQSARCLFGPDWSPLPRDLRRSGKGRFPLGLDRLSQRLR